MESIVLTHLTIPEVRQLFRQELANFFANNQQSLSQKRDLDQPDRLNREQALKFLNDQGIIISESHLYKLTAAKLIPFEYFGRKLVFSRKELLTWVESQTVDPHDTSEVELALAKSARRKKKGVQHA
jgi:hypothetical protein